MRTSPQEDRRAKYVTGLVIRVIVCGVFSVVLASTAYLAEQGSEWHFSAAIAVLALLALTNGPFWIVGQSCGFPLIHFYAHWLTDLVCVTIVLHLLGGVELPYGSVGYMIMILTSAVFVSARASIVVATGSLLFFNSLILAEHFAFIPSYPEIWEHGYSTPVIVFIVMAADVFFYLFAYLAGSLAEELKAANQEVAKARDEMSAYSQLLEQKVTERTAVLELRNREIKEFINIITHDLRNVVIASAEIARLLVINENDQLSARGQRYAAHLLDDSRTMSRMLSGLLALFRHDSDGHVKEQATIATICREAIESRRSRIEATKASVEVRSVPEVFVEKEEFQHILVNLIDNALKYARPNVVPHIAIEGWSENGQSIVTVTDNGVGIPEIERERIFELYHRGWWPRGAELNPDGLGLGLAMVKKLIEKRGGQVSVESKVGVGSAFRLSWPTNRSH